MASDLKTAFVLDWDNQTICCPNQVTLPFTVAGKVQFPKAFVQLVR